jgi:hypothetical protein
LYDRTTEVACDVDIIEAVWKTSEVLLPTLLAALVITDVNVAEDVPE